MKNSELKLICNNCGRAFTKADIEIKEKYLGAMITEQYYHCPYCNFKYIVGLFDNKFRELKRKSERLAAIRKHEEAEKTFIAMKRHADLLNGRKGL